jgi:hypothetical protein
MTARPPDAIAYMHAVRARPEELGAGLDSLMKPTPHQEGCITFDLHQGGPRPGRVLLRGELGDRGGLRRSLHDSTPAEAALLTELTDDSGTIVTRLPSIA